MVRGSIQVGDLHEAIRVAYDFDDVCRIFFGKDELYLPVVHASNVVSAKIRLEESAFETYESDGISFGVSLEKIQKIVSNSPKDSDLEFLFKEEDGRLEFNVDGQLYRIALVDFDSINQNIPSPNIDYTATVTIRAEDFDRSVTASDMFSDQITFKYDTEERVFLMSARGDADITKQDLDFDDLIEYSGESSEVSFNLDFITKLNKAIPEDTEIQIQFKTDRPALFTYDVVDGTGEVRYQLAPAIDVS